VFLTFFLTELDSLVFYFISTSSFYDSVVGVYAAELAVAKFSLKEGVIDDVQIRINPGELPLGSLSAAQEKSQKFHRYPLPPNCEGETSYMKMLETIVKFIHPLPKLPIFFTEGNTRDNKIPLQQTCKIVDKIFYESQEDDLMTELKIYPVEELFFILQKTTAITKNRQNGTFEKPFFSISFAADRFESDDFRYTSKGCDFHNEEDVAQFCCLSKVRRYCYNLAKWCCDNRRYQLNPGKHFPETYDI
jgi:piRNA pathway germ-plasm component